jgi:hypothetical protein
MNTDDTDLQLKMVLPNLFDPCKSVSSVLSVEFLLSDPRSSEPISGKLLLFRSPDHQITRDHPILFDDWHLSNHRTPFSTPWMLSLPAAACWRINHGGKHEG